jgi:hypothetical protein
MTARDLPFSSAFQAGRCAMLRLTRTQDTGRDVIIKVEGQIVEDWATFLEQECLSAREPGQTVSIDLADVHFVDTRAIQALQRLSAARFPLLHCPPLVEELLRTTEST